MYMYRYIFIYYYMIVIIFKIIRISCYIAATQNIFVTEFYITH